MKSIVIFFFNTIHCDNRVSNRVCAFFIMMVIKEVASSPKWPFRSIYRLMNSSLPRCIVKPIANMVFSRDMVSSPNLDTWRKLVHFLKMFLSTGEPTSVGPFVLRKALQKAQRKRLGEQWHVHLKSCRIWHFNARKQHDVIQKLVGWHGGMPPVRQAMALRCCHFEQTKAVVAIDCPCDTPLDAEVTIKGQTCWWQRLQFLQVLLFGELKKAWLRWSSHHKQRGCCAFSLQIQNTPKLYPKLSPGQLYYHMFQSPENQNHIVL